MRTCLSRLGAMVMVKCIDGEVSSSKPELFWKNTFAERTNFKERKDFSINFKEAFSKIASSSQNLFTPTHSF